MSKFLSKTLAAFALTAGLAYAGAASATILVTDNDSDGSFLFDDITYGNGTGRAFVTPLLFTSDFGNTQPAATQVGGVHNPGAAGIDYSYGFSTGSGAPVVNLTYTFANVRDPKAAFPDVNGLRFMLDVTPHGSSVSPTTDKATQNWPGAVAGDPDKRQIQDLGAGALNTILVSNNGVSDGTFSNNCITTGCTTDFGLEWDRTVLKPGETWTIKVTLVDDPALVTGGRWLKAESLDGTGNVLVVGNPTLVPEPGSYAMLLGGIAILVLVSRRRLSALG